jgi:hypothetical protein
MLAANATVEEGAVMETEWRGKTIAQLRDSVSACQQRT